MTILQTPETPELTDPIAEAIQAHLNNPNIPVTRIVKDFKVSRATFYRRLKSVSLGHSSQAVVTTKVECPEGCGTMIDPAWSDERILNHWVNDCKTVSWIIQHDARKLLSTAKSASAFRETRESCQSESTPQNVLSSNCADTSQDMMILGLPSTTDTTDTAERISVESTQPLNDSLPASAEDFGAYAAEVKRELWGDSPDSLDPFFDKFSPITGEVHSDWSMQEWTLGITGGVKFGTRDCTSVTHPRRKR